MIRGYDVNTGELLWVFDTGAEDPKTLPTPENIMPAYLYLMGDDSLHMNGQSIDAQD